MITDSFTLKQLRREIWEMIRFWRYECDFDGSKGCPYPRAADMDFTPNLMHAMCYWKNWLSSKKEYRSLSFMTCYNESNYDRGVYEKVHFRPDRGEYEDIDYVLFDTTGSNNDIWCMLETEYGSSLSYTKQDFTKLCKYKSPLKVMVNNDKFYNSKINYMQETIRSCLASGQLDNNSNEEWLFLGFPYMTNKKWPTKPSEVIMQIHTLTFPCDGHGITLREPDWNIWEKNESMEEWIRSQH